MASRCLQVARPFAEANMFALRPSRFPPPDSTQLRHVAPVNRLRELVGARSRRRHVLVTTTPATLAWAAERFGSRADVVHFLHATLRDPSAVEAVIRYSRLVSRLIVPVDIDRATASRALGVDLSHVRSLDDFTLPTETTLSTASRRVVVAVGAIHEFAVVKELVLGFVNATRCASDWQLRIYGFGSQRRAATNFIRVCGVDDRAFVMGPAYNVTKAYAEAGIVVRIGPTEANGLSVYEGLSAGIPVIGGVTIPAVRRRVIDQVNGVVLARTDADSVAEALALVMRPSTRRRLAAGARDLPCGLLTEQARHDFLDCLLAAD